MRLNGTKSMLIRTRYMVECPLGVQLKYSAPLALYSCYTVFVEDSGLLVLALLRPCSATHPTGTGPTALTASTSTFHSLSNGLVIRRRLSGHQRYTQIEQFKRSWQLIWASRQRSTWNCRSHRPMAESRKFKKRCHFHIIILCSSSSTSFAPMNKKSR